jgi:hypothetical protein
MALQGCPKRKEFLFFEVAEKAVKIQREK